MIKSVYSGITIGDEGAWPVDCFPFLSPSLQNLDILSSKERLVEDVQVKRNGASRYRIYESQEEDVKLRGRALQILFY